MSPGGATLRNEAPPVSPKQERDILTGLIHDLNALYGLNLGMNVDLRRHGSEETPTMKKVLVIGGSHAGYTGDVLEERGYEVIRSCKPGVRIIKPVIATMVKDVAEKVTKIGPEDYVIVQALDNTAYMGRSEEAGDLPIRRLPNGKYHVDGDLVIANYERQKMMFNALEPVLRLLDKRNVILLTPMPRWLYRGCCRDPEHAPNRRHERFEETLRSDLSNFRKSFKNLCFTSNLRFKILDPSPLLTLVDEDGQEIWGEDPVHPRSIGYHRIVDLIESETASSGGRGQKRSGAAASSSGKRQRLDSRAAWIEGPSDTATRRGENFTPRGRGGHRGGPRGRTDRGRPPRGNRGRGGLRPDYSQAWAKY